MNIIWITWEKQPRNRGISSALGCKFYELDLDTKSRIKRYIKSIYQTINAIKRDKPKVVIAQNPSIILASLVIICKWIFKYKAVIDAHNGGIYPFEGKRPLLLAIARWLQKTADMTIITNNLVYEEVKRNGGAPFILPDKLPDIEIKKIKRIDKSIKIVFICTYAADEPYKEVFKAAEQLVDNIKIHVTGRFTGKVDPKKVPSNVILEGFIPDNEYLNLLNSADIIMDLTTRNDCLVCGAYEAVSLNKPQILSDTPVLKEYFHSGCIYVAPDRASIVEGINIAVKNLKYLQKDIKKLKNDINERWSSIFIDFKEMLETI